MFFMWVCIACYMTLYSFLYGVLQLCFIIVYMFCIGLYMDLHFFKLFNSCLYLCIVFYTALHNLLYLFSLWLCMSFYSFLYGVV